MSRVFATETKHAENVRFKGKWHLVVIGGSPRSPESDWQSPWVISRSRGGHGEPPLQLPRDLSRTPLAGAYARHYSYLSADNRAHLCRSSRRDVTTPGVSLGEASGAEGCEARYTLPYLRGFRSAGGPGLESWGSVDRQTWTSNKSDVESPRITSNISRAQNSS
jgi:hypothetical protein